MVIFQGLHRFPDLQGSSESPNQKAQNSSENKYSHHPEKKNIDVKKKKREREKGDINLNSSLYILSKNDHTRKNFFPEGS